MEISIAKNSAVNRRGEAQVPPPMFVIADSVLSMEYKWSVSCHPEFTEHVHDGFSAAKREQIVQIVSNLNLKLVVTVLEGYPSAHACVWIEDVDGALMTIFNILNAETEEFSVEISYLGQILLFHRFKFIVHPVEATQANWIKLSSDPAPKLSQFEAWLLKSSDIRTEDFRVTLSMRVEDVD